MSEIIVIRAADPDGSLFQAIVDALKDRRAEIIHVTAQFSAVLRIGELEINHEHRRVLMAGREVRLNHGEYAILSCMAKRSDLHKRTTLCCGVGRDLSLWFQCCRKHHLPAAEKTGTRSEESSLY